MTKQIKIVVFFFCLIKLTLHLFADYHTGFQGDELLHIEAGNHLGIGYMEFPPLIGLLAFIQNIFHSNSVFVHHIFVHIASILILIYTAKTTVELGGKTKAVFLVLLSILIAPGFGRSHQLFQPVVFSQLFWVLSFYQLTKYVKFPNAKTLWYLTITIGLGFLTKYDILFFIIGLPILFFFKKIRQALIEQNFWRNILLFILIITPNIIWQILNDFPFIQMMNRLYETQLNKLIALDVIWKLILSINPISLLIIIPAIVYLFSSRENKRYLPIALTILISTLVLAYSQGKQYYFFPIILTLLPFGAVFWETKILNKIKWIIYPLSFLLLLGLALIPFGLPIYSLENYIKYDYPYEKIEIEGGKYGIRYEDRYSKEKWKKTMIELKSVFDSLSKSEQENCLIWGKHYSQAGAVNLFKAEYNLPNAFSYHGSFYIWAPNGEIPETVIAFSHGDTRISFFSTYFENVEPIKRIYNPYSDEVDELWQTIYICKNPKQNFTALKKSFKNRIFE
ncbi:MAG: glycosyltransferase family 39 protein [Flavobacteriaceae bacterium]|nr:glycosyltransferase family 39 protein [Flavobacteriaceae bacterium]